MGRFFDYKRMLHRKVGDHNKRCVITTGSCEQQVCDCKGGICDYKEKVHDYKGKVCDYE